MRQIESLKLITSFGKRPVHKPFDELMAHCGVNKYVHRLEGAGEASRFEKHRAMGHEALSVVLTVRPRWKAAYGVCVEYDDGMQDFLEVGQHRLAKEITTGKQLVAFAKSKATERHWREWMDTVRLLANAGSGGDRRWTKVAVVFVARFGKEIASASTDIIRPLKKPYTPLLEQMARRHESE
jgi:hypothetical protein